MKSLLVCPSPGDIVPWVAGEVSGSPPDAHEAKCGSEALFGRHCDHWGWPETQVQQHCHSQVLLSTWSLMVETRAACRGKSHISC